jgi:TrmH family RNA methyltransferase
VILTNPRADSVKKVRALFELSARQRHRRFVIEGPLAVWEAVHYANDTVRDVYVTERAARRQPEVIAAARHVHLATPEVLDAMSPDAQGILAVADIRAITLDDFLAKGKPRLVAVLSNARDPGNVGTVIRTADAAGADAVILVGNTVDPHNPKVVRASVGSLFHIPVISSSMMTGLAMVPTMTALRAAGLAILAADGSGANDVFDYPHLAAPTAWLFGNESWGLRGWDFALSNAVVSVPILGRAESLNLATAAAVCLYASARAHRN